VGVTSPAGLTIIIEEPEEGQTKKDGQDENRAVKKGNKKRKNQRETSSCAKASARGANRSGNQYGGSCAEVLLREW